MPQSLTPFPLPPLQNNRLPHGVRNGGDAPRIHLIIDVAETPRTPRQLRVGEVCSYSGATVVCPQAAGAAAGAAAAVAEARR